jgi:hypothetical protein
LLAITPPDNTSHLREVSDSHPPRCGVSSVSFQAEATEDSAMNTVDYPMDTAKDDAEDDEEKVTFEDALTPPPRSSPAQPPDPTAPNWILAVNLDVTTLPELRTQFDFGGVSRPAALQSLFSYTSNSASAASLSSPFDWRKAEVQGQRSDCKCKRLNLWSSWKAQHLMEAHDAEENGGNYHC